MDNLTKEPTATIKEFAEILKVSRDVIEKYIKKLYPNKMAKGKTTHLTELECTTIKNKLKENSFIDFRQVSEVTTRQDDIRIIQEGYERLLKITTELKEENEALQKDKTSLITAFNCVQADKRTMLPKVEFYDEVTESGDYKDMAEVAQVLKKKGFGRNNLFALLRGKGIFKKNNQPYQEYVERGYFRLVEQSYKVNGETKINLKAVVSQRGLEFILKFS